MSWDELSTRLRQEAGKRLDAALYRAGVQPAVDARSDPGRASGKFFFTKEELHERVRLVQQYLPLEADACVQEAGAICRRRFRLLGYDTVDYGKGGEIDWHLDAVHDKRTPLIPWYKIDFLDFNVAGDHKVTWELNRHQHLVTLAKAWLFTHDERYANEAIAQWYSWQKANPYPLGVNWASSLEVAFRSLSWLWLENLVADWPLLPVRFASDLRLALALSGRHIERYLSTYFSPNTHLLGEAVALFFLGTLCPQLAAAQRWRLLGWRIIEQEAQRQVLPDGVYFEQSLYYHVYALDFFLHARLLASRNGTQATGAFDEVIRKMLAVVRALAQAGPPDGFGDDDGGRLFNPRRNRAEHMTDPLSVGAGLFHDESLRISSTLTEETIWLFGCDAIAETSTDEGPNNLRSQCFPDGGLYLAASPDTVPQQVAIDAGPQGTGRGGHGHADALSLKLWYANCPWLVDAGTFVYISPNNDRQAFRGTRAHNTLAVDGLDQAQPEGPFAWSALPGTETDNWIPAATFTLFAGSHSGYERLAQPVRHRRFVFHLHGNFWLVRDVAQGRGSHLLETSWHFAPDLTLSARGDSFVALPPPDDRTGSDPAHLTLLPVPDPDWKSALISEFVSPAYGAKVPASVLRCNATVTLPAEHAMLLVPSIDRNEVVGRFGRAEEQPPNAENPAIYKYDCLPTVHWMVFSPAGVCAKDLAQAKPTVWTFGPWTSDASFLYFCVLDQKVSHMVACNASRVHLHGEPVFSCDAPLQYLEWLNRKGERWTNSSDDAAARSLSVKAMEASILL